MIPQSQAEMGRAGVPALKGLLQVMLEAFLCI